MASPQPKTIAASKPLPEANGDFYLVAETLAKEDNDIRLKVRAFMEAEVRTISSRSNCCRRSRS